MHESIYQGINRDCHGREHMIVGFTTTCAISAYHQYNCEFEPRSCKVYSIQHYVIEFVSDLRQDDDFLGVLQVEETKNEDWLPVRKAIFRKKAELL